MEELNWARAPNAHEETFFVLFWGGGGGMRVREGGKGGD